ncbi:MAG: hypothetical protein GXY19_05630 [Phycisphaerae bacterium]|nr:hypothetical protein [Phycisphaerae bacterium]
MRSLVRHTVLILATGCFLAMTLGLVLFLHLHLAHDHDEDPQHHDSEHCCLCQQLLVATKDFTARIEPAHVEIDRAGQLLEACLDTAPPQTTAMILGARAPPV